MNSILRWVGGKHRLSGLICSMVPTHTRYVETCAGGAWVFFRKEPSKCEVLNDVDGDLVNLYQVVQKDGLRLVRTVDSMPYSRWLFQKMKASRPTTAFNRAIRFLYLNRTCFGGRMEAPVFGVNKDGRSRVLPDAIRLDPNAIVARLRGVILENLDCEAVIDLYDAPDTLFFVDPPYLGLSQPYADKFTLDDHRRLASRLRRIRGQCIVSYNDAPAIRRLYPGFVARTVGVKYSVSDAGQTDARELILTNFRPFRDSLPSRNVRQ